MKGFGIHFGSTLRFGTVACTISVPSMSCVRHTGSTCAASSNPFLFLFESGHWLCLLLCSSHWQSVIFQTWKTQSCHSPLPYVSYSVSLDTLQIRFFFSLVYYSQVGFRKSQLTDTKVSRRSSDKRAKTHTLSVRASFIIRDLPLPPWPHPLLPTTCRENIICYITVII
jgi:hypothetical protein